MATTTGRHTIVVPVGHSHSTLEAISMERRLPAEARDMYISTCLLTAIDRMRTAIVVTTSTLLRELIHLEARPTIRKHPIALYMSMALTAGHILIRLLLLHHHLQRLTLLPTREDQVTMACIIHAGHSHPIRSNNQQSPALLRGKVLVSIHVVLTKNRHSLP